MAHSQAVIRLSGYANQLQLVANDATGAPTLTDMGASFAIARGGVPTLFIAAPPNGSSVWVRVVDEVSGAVLEQEITVDLPANTQFLSPRLFMNNGATAAAVAYDCSGSTWRRTSERTPIRKPLARIHARHYAMQMNQEAEKRIAAKLAKTMAMLCVRNTHLETIHAGKTPVTKSGDWSDVNVVDADGNRISWTDVSHIGDDQMRALMREIVNRLYTFHLCADEPGLQDEIERWMTVAGPWDEPEIDQRMTHIDVRPDCK